MATANIQLATPPNGGFVGTWDQPVNANSTVIDAVAGSITTKSLTNANVTLSVTEAQVAILRFTGVLTGNCIITLPAIIKSWICENLTTLSAPFVVKISGSSGNVVALRPGSSQVYWDGTNVKFINLGSIGDYWDTSDVDTPLWVSSCTVPPALLCDGSTFSAVTYPILANHIGTTLPDFRGRMAAYMDGGTGRITSAGSGINGSSLYSPGGAQNITLDATTIPSHTHTVNDPGHTHTTSPQATNTNTPGAGFASGVNGQNLAATIQTATTGISLNSTGSGGAHNNMPPTIMSGVRMIWAG